jgi:outer membrane receptor for ferrienterochelin and colicins
MSPSNLPFRFTLLAAALSALVSAHAQQSGPAGMVPMPPPQPVVEDKKAEPAMQKIEVRGSANSYNARRDDTASKMVVNHEEIIKYGDTTVVDVLKRLPGITIGGAGRGGNDIRMRGLGAGYTQILVNGERPPSGFSLENVAPDLIERIEVMRSASAEFSTQSIAGTINVILKKAVAGKLQREVKLSAGGSKLGRNSGLNLQISNQVGKLSYSVSGNMNYSEYHNSPRTVEEFFDRDGNRTRLHISPGQSHGQNSSVGIGPRLVWKLDDGDSLTYQSFINFNRGDNTSASKTSYLPGDPLPYAAWNGQNGNQFANIWNNFNWVHQGENGTKLDVKATFGATRYKSNSRNLAFYKADLLGYDTVHESDSLGRYSSSNGKYTTPIVEGHALAVGWDGGLSTQHEDTLTLREVNFPGDVAHDTHSVFAAKVSRLALFAQDEWNLTPDWSLYVGARWEGIQTGTSGDSFAGATSRSSVFSPLMQTLYKLPGGRGDQLRFAMTNTYKAPLVYRLNPRRYQSANNSLYEPDWGGNPNLKPELAFGLDASYEHYWAEGALVSISVSSRKIDDYMRDGIVLDAGRYVNMPINAGKAETRGLELETKFPLKAVVANAPAIDLRMSVSRNWSSVDSVPYPDNRLSEQTPLSATVGIDYKNGALMTGSSFAFRNGGAVRVSDNHISYVSVRRDLDMYALWKFNPKNQMRVSLSNLLGQGGVDEQVFFPEGGESNHRRTDFEGVPSIRATIETKF